MQLEINYTYFRSFNRTGVAFLFCFECVRKNLYERTNQREKTKQKNTYRLYWIKKIVIVMWKCAHAILFDGVIPSKTKNLCCKLHVRSTSTLKKQKIIIIYSYIILELWYRRVFASLLQIECCWWYVSYFLFCFCFWIYLTANNSLFQVLGKYIFFRGY